MRFFQGLSIRRKLTLTNMLISCVVLILAVAVFVVYDLVRIREAVMQRIAIEAHIFAGGSPALLAVQDHQGAVKALASLSVDPYIVAARIVAADGKVLANYSRPGTDLAALPQPFGQERSWRSWGYVGVREPVRLHRKVVGAVEVYASTEEFAAHVERYLLISLSLIVLLGAVAFVLSNWLQRVVSKPILALGTLAREVTMHRDYSLRAEVQGSDELGMLTADFNRMLEQIQRRDEMLEEQVAQRTTELVRLNDQLKHQAYHDALTKLPNRALFDDRLTLALARAERGGSKIAALFLDLDRFKTVNDTLGHEVGDEMLRVIAGRLLECVRREDTVARLGGDEFTVILNGIEHAEHAGSVAQNIINAISRSLVIGGKELRVTTSIGISIYPDDATDSITLKRNADAAMYHAKEQGRNNYQFFSNEMNVRARERLMLDTELRRAIEQEEFVLFYQPEIEATTNRIIAVEALVRWRSPERGLVTPDQFVPFAEETGLITRIDSWVLRTACAHLARWRAEHGYPLRMAVNLSVHNFRRRDLIAAVESVLEETGLEPSALELEITESSLMRSADEALVTLLGLKELGVSLAVDDFGTGYSSLSYLKRFPINTIKIDKSFIRDVTWDADDAAITRAIVALAKSLNLRVVAEGVETVEQLRFLESLQCHAAQGFLFFKPLPAAEVAALLSSNAQAGVPPRAHGGC